MIVRVDLAHATVGGDDPRGHQVVAGQPRPVGVVPDAAAEREAADAHAETSPTWEYIVAERGGIEDVRVSGGTAHDGLTGVLVDDHLVEIGDIDDQSLGGAEAGVAVGSAASHRRHTVGA